MPAQQQAQPPQQPQPPVVMLADGRLQQPAPLGAVVSDALRRWYLETEKEALRGDVVSRTKLMWLPASARLCVMLGKAGHLVTHPSTSPFRQAHSVALPPHTPPCLAARPAEGAGAAGPDAD